MRKNMFLAGVLNFKCERYVLRVNYAHARASVFTGVLNFTSDFQLTLSHKSLLLMVCLHGYVFIRQEEIFR